MTRIAIYQVDAFSSRVFGGNPAAVCPLESWLDDALMQQIAAENNLSETAFFVRGGERYGLRWFTPVVEVDLCGHATLASAFVLFSELEPERAAITFSTRSGDLTVTRDGDRLMMDFPSIATTPCDPPADLVAGLGCAPLETRSGMDLLVLLEDEAAVRALRPHMDTLARLDTRGVIATAPGDSADFVSRFFAPAYGLPEDPVTGSAHCALAPYWAARLGKTHLHALQVSARGGELWCEDAGARVRIAGRAAKFLHGTIEL
ncbi:MAG TPA: PhzF family phenazine biosynthesis protein [Kouleothrix sp.]|nr:PhzF family phenazine biosynthesis protein [Kouleothrix sp.]